MSLGAMFGWSSSKALIPEDRVEDRLVALEGMKMAELQSKAEIPVGAGPAVKNGSRDRFGNLRKNVGGRPKKMSQAEVVPAKAPEDEGDTQKKPANRKVPGESFRNEPPATEKLRMIRELQEKEKEFWADHGPAAPHGSFRRSMQEGGLAKVWRSRWPSWKKKDLKALIAKEDVWKQRVVEQNLAQGHTGQISSKGRRTTAISSRSQGIRARGGGRKNMFMKFWVMVKGWHAFERMLAKTVHIEDVWLELKARVLHEIAILDAFEEKVKISAKQIVWRGELKSRLKKLESDGKYRERYLQRLCAWGQMTIGRPSRYTDLTPAQEEINWQITHQGFDRAQWLVGFGTEEDLKPHIADPPKFMERRAETAMVFSDQVPVWIKIGNRKAVFSAADKAKRSKGRPDANLHQQMSQALKSIDEMADAVAADGQSQTRGDQKSGDEKFRITLECRQAVLNWFGDEDPVGVVLPPVLVLWGVHCRLSNITKERTWKEDETFTVAGVEVKRHKGGKIPNSMMSDLLDLRDKRPELFANVVVMQQPSATVDEVIIGWGMEDLMERFPQFLLQRDLVSGALSENAKLAAKIAHAVCCWVGPGMTPVCQLTDTDIAFVLKSFIRRSKDRLVLAMRQRAADAGERASFCCSNFEILTMVAESHRDLVKRNEETQLILAGLRRNANFAWRADIAAGKMVKVDGQEWAAKMKMGSHRYPESWLLQRFDWLDAKGVPINPDWRRTLADGSTVDESEDQTQEIIKYFAKDVHLLEDDRFTVDHVMNMCGRELKIQVMEIEFDEMDVLPPELAELLKTPHRDHCRVHVDEQLQRRFQKTVKKVRCAETQSRMRLALCGFTPEMHDGLASELKMFTRMEVMRKMKFVCSTSKTPKAVKKNSLKMAKMKKAQVQPDIKLLISHRVCCVPSSLAELNKWAQILKSVAQRSGTSCPATKLRRGGIS